MTNSGSLHKGVTEFLGWRDPGDPNTLISYRMVKRREETEKRLEEQDGVDKVLCAGGETVEKMSENNCLGEGPDYVEENPTSIQTQMCAAQNQGSDCYILEGALPMLNQGWNWVKQSQVATKPAEVAEAMVKQYLGKNLAVKAAIGKPSGDYLERVRRMTTKNCSVFRIKKVTEKQVKDMIRNVDNKGSFGIDLISYKDIKLLENYVSRPLTELINLSIETRYYPSRWKTARVKPLWKGKGNDRKIPKSYRPVALLAACARIMEALIARQVDEYAESKGILHRNVHGYRKGRGTDTALLEVWESVMEDIDAKKMVAMCLLDVSDGFGSVPHTNLLRKLETYGYDNAALDWFASYLEDRDQYVVVETTDSRTFETDRGIPQGGPLCPSMFREYTNDLPEEVKCWGGDLLGERGEDRQGGLKSTDSSVVSTIVDKKEERQRSEEDRFDIAMRQEGNWNIESWRGERTEVGPNQLRVKKNQEPHDGRAEL